MALNYKKNCIFAKLNIENISKINYTNLYSMKLTKTFFAVAISLLALATTSCNETPAASTSTLSSADSTAAVEEYSGKIAFIRMDSLMSGYGLYIDLGAEFGKKQQKIQKELENKGRSLEREVMAFQEKAQKGLITTYQARTAEEGLQKKQQQIVAYRDRVLAEMSEEEAVIGAKISAAVLECLKEYNADKKYSMIMQTIAGNPVILADPALDITAEVLVELNKRYEATIATK